MKKKNWITSYVNQDKMTALFQNEINIQKEFLLEKINSFLVSKWEFGKWVCGENIRINLIEAQEIKDIKIIDSQLINVVLKNPKINKSGKLAKVKTEFDIEVQAACGSYPWLILEDSLTSPEDKTFRIKMNANYTISVDQSSVPSIVIDELVVDEFGDI
jgi:hypothetical protein